MHSKKINETQFHFDGGLEGDLEIYYEGNRIRIPAQDVVKLVFSEAREKELFSHWKQLFDFISREAFDYPSILFSSPYVQKVVDMKDLIDKIAEIRGVSEIQNRKDFNSVVDELEGKSPA